MLEKTLWDFNNKSHAPIHWIGSKGKLLFRLLPLIPYTDVFVDVFGGSCSVLLNRKPSFVEIYNDKDQRLVNFFRVLQDQEKFDVLLWRLHHTMYARAEFNKAKLMLVDSDNDKLSDIDQAWAFYVVCNQSFCSNLIAWGFCKKADDRNLSGGCASRFDRNNKHLNFFSERIRNVQIECDDACAVIKRYDNQQVIFYCDPPYLLEAKKEKKDSYQHEMSYDQHRELLTCLLNCKGAVVLSGYLSELYCGMLQDWDVRSFNHYSSLGLNVDTALKLRENKTCYKRTEVVWRNPLAVKLCNELTLF